MGCFLHSRQSHKHCRHDSFNPSTNLGGRHYSDHILWMRPVSMVMHAQWGLGGKGGFLSDWLNMRQAIKDMSRTNYVHFGLAK